MDKINSETLEFQSEVKQLLNLMIHSLYSNKEIFLRELISNSSDAADKLRFYALSNSDLYENDSNLNAKILIDKKEKKIKLIDNCMGMNYKDVINNLGIIAKSGTKNFLQSLHKNNITNNTNLIGQFGVGFYSAFIVAKKVKVYTRLAGDKNENGVLWESKGDGQYTISNVIKNNKGTEITLYLREGEEEFLDYWRLKNIVKKYSDHIPLPVEMIDDEEKNKENGKISWKKVNKAQAIWTIRKEENNDTQYKEFYKSISHDVHDPLIWSHNFVEGKQEYISLLYIPSKAPWNIWNYEYQKGIKLYVQRVFIMDEVKYFLPNYLRFVKGLIDSNDLPLNISRETLQDNNKIRNLKNSITKRILIMLSRLSKENKEKYLIFWKQFGLIFKEGPSEDTENNYLISKLIRFASTYNKNDSQNVSLEEYISRMKEKQEKIYYIIAENYSSAQNNPHLEPLNNKNIEVLLLYDRIDAWMMSYLTEFNKIKFQSVSNADFTKDKLFENNIKNNELIDDLSSLVNRIKLYLGNRVKLVRLTHHLLSTPVIVTTDVNDMTTQMSKLLSASGQSIPNVKYILEINPKHDLIKYIAEIKDETIFYKWIEFLFDQAVLVECGSLEDPNKFVKCTNNFIISLIKN